MKKLIILFICFMTSIQFLFGKETIISTQLEVNIIEQDDEILKQDDNPFIYNLKVKQTIKVQNFKNDTLILTFENNSILDCLLKDNFYRINSISYKSKKNGEMEVAKYNCEEMSYILYPKSSSFELVVEYEYYSKYNVFFLNFASFFYYPIMYNYHGWFLSSAGMKVNELSIKSPEKHTFFANLPFEKREKSFYLDVSSIKDNNISFYIIKNEYYHKYTLHDSLTEINLYMLNYTLSSDSIPLGSRSNYDSVLFDTRFENVKRAIKTIRFFFSNNENKAIDIVDCIWRNETSRAGNAMIVDNSKSLIVIDTSFWQLEVFHELLHLFDPITNLTIDDSVRFLFGESFIEYLTIYLLNQDNKNVRDSLYEASILKYLSQNTEPVSIFNIQKNIISEEVNTANTIYNKIPFILYCFGKQIGEERFIDCLKTFYKESVVKKQVSFDDFKATLQRKGVSNEHINWLMTYL